jgi:hypothetical protein
MAMYFKTVHSTSKRLSIPGNFSLKCLRLDDVFTYHMSSLYTHIYLNILA